MPEKQPNTPLAQTAFHLPVFLDPRCTRYQSSPSKAMQRSVLSPLRRAVAGSAGGGKGAPLSAAASRPFASASEPQPQGEDVGSFPFARPKGGWARHACVISHLICCHAPSCNWIPT